MFRQITGFLNVALQCWFPGYEASDRTFFTILEVQLSNNKVATSTLYINNGKPVIKLRGKSLDFSVNNILFNILNKYKQYNITRI